MVHFLLSISCLAWAIQFSGAVTILIINRENEVYFDEFSVDQTVLTLKEQIKDQIGLCPQDIQIVDIYPNAQQDADGLGEYVDWRRLSEFGITEATTGKILYALRRVVINDLIVPTNYFVTLEYLTSSALKLELDGSQTVLDFKELFVFYTAYDGDLSLLLLSDWYDNAAVDADGGVTQDDAPLSRYGFDNQHTGVILEFDTIVENDFHGTLTIFYGDESNVQFNIEYDENQTVWELKVYLSQLTGVPADIMLLFDFSPNPAQDADGGVWQNKKTIKQYGMRNYEEFDLCICTRAPGTPSKPY